MTLSFVPLAHALGTGPALGLGTALGLALGLGAFLWAKARERRTRRSLESLVRERDEFRRDLHARTDFERILLDHIPAPVFIRDEDGYFVHANRAVCTMIGMEHSALVGRRVGDFAREDLAARYTESDARVLAGETVREETEVLDVHGHPHQVVVEKALVRPHREGPRWIVGAFVDITRQKEQERRLAAALAHEERASAAKSEFLAIVSHEMRTPLHGILGLTECLRSEDLNPLAADWVEMIGSAGERMLATVDDMLLLAQLQQGEVELHAKPCVLEATLRSIENSTRDEATTKGLRYRWHFDDIEDVVVVTDSARLRSIARKLVDNAIKFTPEGSVDVHARVIGTDERTCRLHFEVRDTGVGVSPDRATSIFDAFVQGDASARRRFEGNGLGLTIVRHLVTLMGGTVGFESDPSIGSTFWVEISFARAAAVRGAVDADDLQCSTP